AIRQRQPDARAAGALKGARIARSPCEQQTKQHRAPDEIATTWGPPRLQRLPRHRPTSAHRDITTNAWSSATEHPSRFPRSHYAHVVAQVVVGTAIQRQYKRHRCSKLARARCSLPGRVADFRHNPCSPCSAGCSQDIKRFATTTTNSPLVDKV